MNKTDKVGLVRCVLGFLNGDAGLNETGAAITSEKKAEKVGGGGEDTGIYPSTFRGSDKPTACAGGLLRFSLSRIPV